MLIVIQDNMLQNMKKSSVNFLNVITTEFVNTNKALQIKIVVGKATILHALES